MWKIRVFTNDKSAAGIPNILFYVDSGAHVPPFIEPDESGKELDNVFNKETVSKLIEVAAMRKNKLRRMGKEHLKGDL